jgi:hypothetical protein
MKNRKAKVLQYLAFASLAPAVCGILHGIIVNNTSKAAGVLFVLSAGMFVIFGTSSALAEGEFFAQHYECTREKAPISFWTSVVTGYVFGVSLLVLAGIVFRKGF